MPSNLVKTKAQEKLWERAKSAAGKDPGSGTFSKWRLTNFIFQKMNRGLANKKTEGINPKGT